MMKMISLKLVIRLAKLYLRATNSGTTMKMTIDESKPTLSLTLITADDVSTVGGDRNGSQLGSSNLEVGANFASNAHSDTTSVTTSSQEDILTGGIDWVRITLLDLLIVQIRIQNKVWRRKRSNVQKKVHGAVLKKSHQKGMSTQMVSAGERAKAGLPTTLAVNQLLAVVFKVPHVDLSYYLIQNKC
jgi:hypothetical protein